MISFIACVFCVPLFKMNPFIINLFLPKKKRNAIGAAIGTTAGNAAMTPAAVAATDPSYAPGVDAATAMISTASLITLLLCPFITAFCDNLMRRKKLGIYSGVE